MCLVVGCITFGGLMFVGGCLFCAGYLVVDCYALFVVGWSFVVACFCHR